MAVVVGPADGLQAWDVQAESLRLTWIAPSSNGLAILGYQVLAQAGGTSGFSVIIHNTEVVSPQAIVGGLHPGSWCAACTAMPLPRAA